MVFFIILSVVVIFMSCAGIYWFMHKKEQPVEYIWVGHGEDPFKQTKD